MPTVSQTQVLATELHHLILHFLQLSENYLLTVLLLWISSKRLISYYGRKTQEKRGNKKNDNILNI